MSRSDWPTTLADDHVDHDPTFYFTTVTFRVEGTLFRVPKHHFIEQSEVFRAMFELPVANDAVPDGSSDKQPLRLEGVSVTDFRQLLRVMFPTLSRLQSTETFTLSQWTSVLRLCALWQIDDLKNCAFQALPGLSGSREEWLTLLDLSIEHQLPQVRRTAIKKLTPISGNPFDAIAMARKYHVKSWLMAGLQALVQRSQLLSEADEAHLGWRTIIKLCRLRESGVRSQLQSQQKSRKGQQHHSDSWSMSHIEHALESEFHDELKDFDD